MNTKSIPPFPTHNSLKHSLIGGVEAFSIMRKRLEHAEANYRKMVAKLDGAAHENAQEPIMLSLFEASLNEFQKNIDTIADTIEQIEIGSNEMAEACEKNIVAKAP